MCLSVPRLSLIHIYTGKVTAGLYRNGQARNRDIEDGGRLAVHAEAVVLLAVLPRLEVDDKLNLFGHLDRADTEDTANVNDADAAQLDKVADNLGRRTDERLVGYTLDPNRVVRCLLYTSRCV